MLRRMTIIGQAHHKKLPGYERFTVYRALLQRQHLGPSDEIYYVSQDYLTPNQHINIDIDNDTEALRGVFNSVVDGLRVYVQKEPMVQPSGDFKIKRFIGADAPGTDGPVEYFKFHDLARSKFNLFETEHNAYDGSPPSIARVFSEAMFFRDENIPANEVTQIFRRGVYDGKTYYLHDYKLYLERSVAAFGLKKRLG